jgi:hypothetical protein
MKPTCIADTNTYVYNFQKCGFHLTFKQINYVQMKPTCIADTNTYVYNFQTCGLHQTIKIKIIY